MNQILTNWKMNAMNKQIPILANKDTIRNWIKNDQIPFHKIGRQYRFRISEVDEWVISGKSAKFTD